MRSSLLLLIPASAAALALGLHFSSEPDSQKKPATPHPAKDIRVKAADVGQPHPQVSTETEPPADGLTAGQVEALKGLEAMLEKGEDSPDMLLAPFRAWAAKDPRAAALWAARNLNGLARQRCLEEAAALWADKDPQAALEFLQGLGSHEGVEGAFANVLSTLSQRDPAAAAEWLRSHPDLASLENWEMIFTNWSALNPAQATAFLSSRLNATQRDGLLPLLLTRFSDPAFQATLLSQADPVRLQQSLPDAARSIVQQDPARALALLNHLRDAALRQDLQEEMLNDWFLRDAEAARSYARQNGLPDPAR